jgi:2-dehydro-3-deoxygluconokinase
MTAPWPDRITAVGEVLVSLQAPAGLALATAREWTVRIAGAEANFAAAFVRAGGRAGICTAVGVDPPGDRVAAELAGYGLDLTHLHRDPVRPTALMLNERSAGERTVHYYRSGSAASALTVEQVLAAADGAVVLSGVTLAVCADLRERFGDLLAGLVGAGAPLLLDLNLRPALGHVAEVTAALRAAAPHSLAVFAGRDEAAAVFGSDAPAAHAELVLKDGPAGSWVAGVHVPAVPTAVVDPVGAGDAFAGSYSGLRARGVSPVPAARVAARVAGHVVATPGDVDGLPTPAEIDRYLAEAT